MQLKNKLDECFKQGEKGGERHKGLKKIGLNGDLIDEHVKNHQSQTGGMKMPHFVWFLSMLRIPRVVKPLVTNEWNSDI